MESAIWVKDIDVVRRLHKKNAWGDILASFSLVSSAKTSDSYVFHMKNT